MFKFWKCKIFKKKKILAFQKLEASSSENQRSSVGQRKIEALNVIILLLLNTSLDAVDWFVLFIL